MTQTLEVARTVADGGATMLRGGAYKPRTSPYCFQGLGAEGLRLLAEAKEETGLPIVTELMDVRDIEDVVEVADVIQIGARNMQNYSLLAEVGRTGRPGAAEARPLRDARGAPDGGRVRAQGGQREGDALRARHPDVRDGLPVHARPPGGPGAAASSRTCRSSSIRATRPGRRDWVGPMSLAAAAAGADGIIVEVHNEPEEAICDGPQALPTDGFAEYAEQVEAGRRGGRQAARRAV